MNNLLSPQQIIELPYIDGEINTYNKGRRSGHNIYMMHSHQQFKTYNYQQRKNLLIHHNIYNINEYEQHEASPRRHKEPKCTYKIISKVANSMWKFRLQPEIKQAWKDRAIRLNALPPFGQHAVIPNIINNHQAILNSINFSFKDFVSYIHPLIRKDPRNRNPKTNTKPNYKRMFGNERVLMYKQIFCSFFFEPFVASHFVW